MAAPTDIGDLVLWLDATQESFGDGASVATWTDRSGAGNHGTQATASRRPTHSVDGINGRRSMAFVNDNQSNLALPDSLFRTQAGTSFAIARAASVQSTQFVLSGQDHIGVGSTTARHRWYLYAISPFAWRMTAGPNSFTSSPTFTLNFDGSIDTPYVLALRSDGSTVDGVRRCPHEADDETGLGLAGAGQYSTVGAVNHSADTLGGPFQGFDGLIGEIIHYDRRLNDSEHASILNYLSAKWEIVCPGEGFIEIRRPRR